MMTEQAELPGYPDTLPDGSILLTPLAPYDLTLAARFFALRATKRAPSSMAPPTQTTKTTGERTAHLSDERPLVGARDVRLTLYPELHGLPTEIIVTSRGSVLRPKLSVRWRTLAWESGHTVRATLTDNDVITHLRKVLSLSLDLSAFYKILSTDGHLRALPKSLCGLKPALTATIFDAAVWAIVGQQVTLRFALILKERLAESFGRPFHCNDALMYALPKPSALAETDVSTLRRLQLSERKAEYLLTLSRAVAGGDVDLEQLGESPYQDACDNLLSLRGIGQWTANYILMRGAGHTDALPLGDAGLRRAVRSAYGLEVPPDDREITAFAEPYRPFRSLFTLYLWQAFS